MTVHVVTSTANSGSGTLRDAVEVQTGARTIEIRTASPITLTTDVTLTTDNVRIVGRQGAVVSGRRFYVNGADNVFIQDVAFKYGGGTDDLDSFAASNCNNLQLHGCSFAHSVDECLDIDSCTNVLVNRCMIYEALQDAGHASGAHSYAARFVGDGVVQDCIFALCDFRPNLIGDWIVDGCIFYGYGSSYPVNLVVPALGGETTVDIINCRFRTGPDTAIKISTGYRSIQIFDGSTSGPDFCNIHESGNICDSVAFGNGEFAVVVTPKAGVTYNTSGSQQLGNRRIRDLQLIMESWHRQVPIDSDSRRVLNHVFNSTGSIVDTPP